jgi:hypothetical protein
MGEPGANVSASEDPGQNLAHSSRDVLEIPSTDPSGDAIAESCPIRDGNINPTQPIISNKIRDHAAALQQLFNVMAMPQYNTSMPPQRTPTRITAACNGCRSKKQKVCRFSPSPSPVSSLHRCYGHIFKLPSVFISLFEIFHMQLAFVVSIFGLENSSYTACSKDADLQSTVQRRQVIGIYVLWFEKCSSKQESHSREGCAQCQASGQKCTWPTEKKR